MYTLQSFSEIAGNIPLIKQRPKIKINAKLTYNSLKIYETFLLVKDYPSIPAFIIEPKKISRKPVIALHQTTDLFSTGKLEPAGFLGKPDMHYGIEMAKNGHPVVVPDYPLFGQFNIDPEIIYKELRFKSMSAFGIFSHKVCIEIIAHLWDISQGVCSIGHSLGGSNTIFLAMADHRITTCVISAGFSDWGSYANQSSSGDLQGWARKDKYFPLIKEIFNNNPALIKFDFKDFFTSLFDRQIFLNIPLRDDVFPYYGARRVIDAATKCCPGLNDNLTIFEPDCGHSFPEDIRRNIYSCIT